MTTPVVEPATFRLVSHCFNYRVSPNLRTCYIIKKFINLLRLKLDYGFFCKRWAMFALQVSSRKARLDSLYTVWNVRYVLLSRTEGSLNIAKNSTVFVDAWGRCVFLLRMFASVIWVNSLRQIQLDFWWQFMDKSYNRYRGAVNNTTSISNDV